MTIMVATHRPNYGDEAMRLLAPYNPIRVDGTGFPSCSYLWNQCIDRCPDETVIICNERARPKPEHVEKLLRLLAEGFALAGLYRFGFFGFNKDVLGRIGRFDERFHGGWYEDNDCILRLKEAGLAYYESEEVPYLYTESTWTHEACKDHFAKKWGTALPGPRKSRYMPEDPPPSGISTGVYLPWRKSVLLAHSGGQYNRP
jgi:hypothetical protein